MNRPLHEWALDATALASLIAVLGKLLPALAAAFAMAWYAVLIWESKTGQRWRARWRTLYRAVVHGGVLPVEDRLAFLLLGLTTGGLMMATYGIMRVIE